MNLNQVTIHSLDVAKSIAFYKQLGLHLIVEALPHYARFECLEGDATFSIHQVEKLPEGDGTIVYFETKKLDQEVSRLRKIGFTFDLLPTDQTWLWREARLKDPDGNQIILYYAGANRKDPPWRIGNEKGEISAFAEMSEGLEIERKFLVIGENYKKEAQKSTRITQGYLSTDPERTVRVRIKGGKGFLTIKGKSNDSGTTRVEVEEEIAFAKAKMLLNLCLPGIIDKTRYEIPAGKHIWEVDEFYGENKGLTLAEIELNSENETFSKPDWIGNEVTGDKKYYNSQLSSNPYQHWNK